METKLGTPLLNTVSDADDGFDDGSDTIAVGAGALGGVARGQAEDSPSYAILARHGLICARYRVMSVNNLDVTPPNTTRNEHTWQVGLSLLCTPESAVTHSTSFTASAGMAHVRRSHRYCT